MYQSHIWYNTIFFSGNRNPHPPCLEVSELEYNYKVSLCKAAAFSMLGVMCITVCYKQLMCASMGKSKQLPKLKGTAFQTKFQKFFADFGITVLLEHKFYYG